MGRRPLAEGDPRVGFTLHLQKSHKQAVESAAFAEGIGRSEWIRRVIVAQLETLGLIGETPDEVVADGRSK